MYNFSRPITKNETFHYCRSLYVYIETILDKKMANFKTPKKLKLEPVNPLKAH